MSKKQTSNSTEEKKAKQSETTNSERQKPNKRIELLSGDSRLYILDERENLTQAEHTKGLQKECWRYREM